MRFEAILQKYNVPYVTEGHHHCTPGWLQVDCPHCSPRSSRWRMGYCIKGRFVRCWTCGGHRLGETLSLLIGQPWSVVKELLNDLPREVDRYEPKARGKLVVPDGVGPLLRCHKDYLQGRGFDPHELERIWGVKGIGLAPELAWRIWIPIHYRGEVVSWTTRSLSDEGLRYISARPEQERMSMRELLLGEDMVGHTIVVTEGPMDAMRIGPGAVCTLGTSYSTQQLKRMARFPVRYVAFDADAQAKARRLCNDLSVFPGETLNIRLDSADPGSASEREIAELRGLLA